MVHTVTAMVFFWLSLGDCTEKSQIPKHLLDCYRTPSYPLLPMNIETMTDIVRKISFNYYVPVSLMQEISDVLNWFSVEGLERSPNVARVQNVIPYHRTGFQAHKQDLLFDKLIPIKRRSFEAHSLSISEKCTLHRMMSSSVDFWERGDEFKTCPNSPPEFRNMTADRSGGAGMYSVCPLEGGVVLTAGGSVSMSRLLSALLAAMTHQEVPLSQLMTQDQLIPLHLLPKDTISNIWAATLAGDLAEVALEQSPLYNMDVKIGITGRWNNTDIPTRFYFDKVPFTVIEKQQWQITDAEMLGGIDGILLGNSIMKMEYSMQHTLRLSQLLDTYYSNWTIQEDHVCKRKSAFNTFMRDQKKTLHDQTRKFAALLSTTTTVYFTTISTMDYRCSRAVEKFMHYYSRLLEDGTCSTEGLTLPRLNLYVVLDATWPPYTSLEFLMSLTQTFDISYFGGSIAVINQDAKTARVNKTSDPIIMYQQMLYGNQNDPKELKLDNSFTAFKNILEAENLHERNLAYPRHASQVVLVVMGHASTISDKDLRDSIDSLKSLKSLNPEVQYIYITSSVNSKSFQTLLNTKGAADSDQMISTDDTQTGNIINLLRLKLKTERVLKPAYCKADQHQWPEAWYTEFITPGQTNGYWIHPDYFYRSLDIVKINFKNYHHGELKVCMSRGQQRGDCQVAGANTEVTHAVLRPCDLSDTEACLPLYFTVNVLQSYSKCSDFECRYPNQVRFSIIVQDLHCINLNTDVCSKGFIVCPNCIFLYKIMVFVFVILLRSV